MEINFVQPPVGTRIAVFVPEGVKGALVNSRKARPAGEQKGHERARHVSQGLAVRVAQPEPGRDGGPGARLGLDCHLAVRSLGGTIQRKLSLIRNHIEGVSASDDSRSRDR